MATTDAEKGWFKERDFDEPSSSGVRVHWEKPPPESSTACPFVNSRSQTVSIVSIAAPNEPNEGAGTAWIRIEPNPNRKKIPIITNWN